MNRISSVVALFYALITFALPANAQVTNVFNKYNLQPDVWHPAEPAQAGVDAKGDLNLSIPVMTVPGRGGLDFNIRFNYRSGVRVDQRASWIGMGWEFDPGSITRDPMGVVVKKDGTYTAFNVDFTSYPTYQPDAYYVSLPAGSSMMTRFHAAPGTDPNYPAQSSAIPPPRSNTSQFYLNEWRPWKVETSSLNPVTVDGVSTSVIYSGTSNRADYNQFKITADDGTRYVFAHPTLSTYDGLSPTSGVSSVEYYVAVWRLVSILGPDYNGPDVPTGSEQGSWIRLTYTTPLTGSTMDGGRSHAYKIQSAYLTEILTPTHKATFTKTTRTAENFALFERQANLYSKLTEIKLFAVGSSTVLQKINVTSSPRFEGQSSSESPRLALDSLKIVGKGGTDTSYPPYKFEYFPREGTNFSKDDFGYYNHSGLDFDSNTTDGRSWSLKRIVYPEGGFDEFAYENDLVTSGEAVDYSTFSATSGTHSNTYYGFNTWGYRQGGARISSVKRNPGMGTTVTSNYTYGPGRSSGVPPRHWERNFTGNLYSSSERGRAAVYYEFVKSTNAADNSSVVIFYTTPTHSSYVKRLQSTQITYGGGFTLAQGNQDWNWGKAHKTAYHNGTVPVRVEDRIIDLSSAKLAGAFTLPSEVNVVWGFPDKVSSETITDCGESDCDLTGTIKAVKTTSYTHNILSGSGTGYVRKVTETSNSSQVRAREFLYGHEKYSDLNSRNILRPVIREDIMGGSSGPYLGSTVTTWKAFQVLVIDEWYTIWKPYQTFAWREDTAPSTQPAFSSWSSGTPDARWHKLRTANTYNGHGLATTESDARGNVTTLTYNTLGQLTKVAKGSVAREFAYYTASETANAGAFPTLPKTVKDENLKVTTYRYDNFGRLQEVRTPTTGTNASVLHTYAFSGRNPDGTMLTNKPNKITTVRKTGGTPASYEMIAFFDGLGRTIQTQDKRASDYVIQAKQFDAMGRSWREWKPYAYASSGNYDASYSTRAVAAYGSGSRPYVETLYKNDALGRVEKIIPENPTTTSPPSIVKNYRVGTLSALGTAKFPYVETIDEVANKTHEYFDTFGNKRAAVTAVGSTVQATTTFTYDAAGNLTQVKDPLGLSSAYLYDTRGFLRQKSAPDVGGSTKPIVYKYDRAGNLRFSQDANQKGPNKALFTSYDVLDRPLISGEAALGATAFSSLDPNTSPAFEGTNTNWHSVNHYGDNASGAKPNTANFPWTIFSTQIGASTTAITNPKGHLTANAFKSDGRWQATLQSFDAEQRTNTKYIFTESATGGVYAGVNTTLSYAYNWQHQRTFTTTAWGTSTSAFRHWYDYDAQGLLSKAYASTTATKPAADVTYLYNPAGLVSSFQYAGGPVMEHTYTIRGWLATMGDPYAYNPSHTSEPLSVGLKYFNNGNVQEAYYTNRFAPSTTLRYKYVHAYDALSRLTAADYSFFNGSYTTSAAYDVTGITYYLSGNLKTLLRKDETGATIDNLTYYYTSGTNRLNNVADAAGATSVTWDLENSASGAFAYDANGNMTKAPAPYGITAASYDWRNMPVSLTDNGTTTKYRYGVHGQRIYKKDGTALGEYYIQDGPLTLMVVYENATYQRNIVAGGQVIGRHPYNASRRYYYKDHLGSIRAVATPSGTVEETSDYYPFGLEMPGRVKTSFSPRKEKFTGKERDAETGLDYFGARYYMPAVGRWAQVDPLADRFPEWSPYNYALSNPLRLVDPDGAAPINAGGGCPPNCATSINQQLYYAFGGPILDELLGRADASAAYVAENPDKILHSIGEAGEALGEASDKARLGFLAASLVPGVQEFTLPAAGLSGTVGLVGDATAVVAYGLEATLFTGDYTDAVNAGRNLVISEVTSGLVNRAASNVLLPAPQGRGSQYRWTVNGQFAPNTVGRGFVVARDATNVILPAAIIQFIEYEQEKTNE